MASSSASSLLSTRVRNYDVFLSFRGEDTRLKVVSYLYEALCFRGIYTFRDDRRLQPGGNISDQLIEAIKNSRFALVVISENYATSKWCLDELQLIMELHSQDRIRVVPFFYEVEPRDVRHQRGTFGAAFQNYGNNTAPEKVSQWKSALNKVSHLAGFHSKTGLDEAAVITNTVGSISSQLLEMRQPSEVDYVGMEAHMVKLHFLLNMGSENEVLMIGIWGMGGVGKTTIARCLYDRFSSQFQARYFEEDIKEIHKDKSPSYLQERFLFKILRGQHIGFLSDAVKGSQVIKERLGHQKVFLVLDGVDKAEQVHALAKESSWFGPGSRIIITTRDRGLLNSCGVNNVHEVKCLDDKDALQVFKKLAFGGGPAPSDGFEQLFIRASRLAHGLPSALEAYASYLSEKKTTKMWEDELDILELIPHQNVEKILRYSYDILDRQDKFAFLHVACLFNGYPFNHVTSLLEAGLTRLNHLTAKSLISITTEECIDMHFLVVQTGREIVRQECERQTSRQKFLWDSEEIYDVLDNERGTDEVEGVTLDMCKMRDTRDTLCISNRVFERMHNIKFLKFFHDLGDIKSNVELRSYDFYFPPDLRLLHWDAYPLEALPSRFRHYHLVEVNLRYSNLESLWDNNARLPRLRRLDVTGSRNLRELPNLSTAECFEELIIEGCVRLQQIPESLQRLSRLRKLNAIHCDILRGIRFTLKLYMISVGGKLIMKFENNGVEVLLDIHIPRGLSIEGQIGVRVTGFEGNADHISFTYKKEIHSVYYNKNEEDYYELVRKDILIGLQTLNIKQFRYEELNAPFMCRSFFGIPNLTTLKLVNLNIQEIPEDIGRLVALEKLDLSGNDFVSLPTSIGQLPKLKYLSLHNCSKTTSLPQLTQVETLILSDCVSLLNLHVGEARGAYCLLELWLDNCKDVQTLSEKLSHFTKLTYLDLSRHDFATLPSSIREFSSLGTLYLNNCKKLISVEGLPLSVKYLHAHGCDSLENVALSPNHSIKHLDLSHCFSLQIQDEQLITRFLNDGYSQEVSQSQRFLCLPGARVPGYFDNQSSGTCTTTSLPQIRFTPTLLGFAACIMMSCERSFYLQFPAFSYDWNSEDDEVIRINLKPNLYHASEIEEEEAVTSHQLVIIHVPGSINADRIEELRLESNLQLAEEFQFPPAEINACGMRMISHD